MFDKEVFKDRPCFKYGKKGHPAKACTKNTDDSLSTSSKSEFSKQLKKVSQALTQLQSSIEADSESDTEQSHFQYGGSFTFTQE